MQSSSPHVQRAPVVLPHARPHPPTRHRSPQRGRPPTLPAGNRAPTRLDDRRHPRGSLASPTARMAVGVSGLRMSNSHALPRRAPVGLSAMQLPPVPAGAREPKATSPGDALPATLRAEDPRRLHRGAPPREVRFISGLGIRANTEQFAATRARIGGGRFLRGISLVSETPTSTAFRTSARVETRERRGAPAERCPPPRCRGVGSRCAVRRTERR